MIRGHGVPVKRLTCAHHTSGSENETRVLHCLAVPAALCRKIYHAFNLLVAMRWAPKFRLIISLFVRSVHSFVRCYARARTACHTLSHEPPHTDTHERRKREAVSVKKSTKNQTERKRYYQKLHSVCLVNTWLLFLKFQEMRSRKNISKFSEARDWQWMCIPAMLLAMHKANNIRIQYLLLL